MVQVEIDGIKVEVPEGSMLMEAATQAGKYVPHFCYHKKLSIAANCRMCLVEVEKAPKPLPACATPVTQGMIVRTQSEKAVQAQKSVMEFLLINHPLDCPICDQGGECQLQDIAVGYGGVTSRYQEEKRVVFHKNIGPLVSAEEMSRCIHCTRCVRFGQEVAGVMELGMANRGEHSEILSFVGNSVDSELSGNMIDLCPVGALTSKPFRYNARTWELARRKSVAAHDSLGSNVIVQVKNDTAMRVVPLENESINECWISDRDRFSYEGLNAQDRLTQPMIKKNGQWVAADWQTAMQLVVEGFKKARRESSDLNAAIACVISPSATFEEHALAATLLKELGSTSIDAGLRHHASLSLKGAKPWLGVDVSDIDASTALVIVGADLRNDQPLLASRIRQASKAGIPVTVVSTGLNDDLMPKSQAISVAPSRMAEALNEAVVSETLSAEEGLKLVLVGQQALMSEYANDILASAQALAEKTGSRLGFLGDGANWVGSFLAGTQACTRDSRRAQNILSKPSKATLVFGSDIELDSGLGQTAKQALHATDFVVVCGAFAGQALEYADVLLPICPATETSGTFVNIAGVVQTFKAAVKPLGESRPGWKVLRALGSLMGFESFESFNQSTDVLQAFMPANPKAELSNAFTPVESSRKEVVQGLELSAYVPTYHVDAVVRRATSLQKTKIANAALIQCSEETLADLNARNGDLLKVVDAQGGELTAKVHVNSRVAKGVLLVPVGKKETQSLRTYSGSASVQVQAVVEA